MSQITVSLETAKKMKEVGWSKSCYFSKNIHTCGAEETHASCCPVCNTNIPSEFTIYELPTAQEILDELQELHGTRITTRREPMEGRYFFCAWYFNLDWIPISPVSNWPSMAEALSKLWMRCKENWYI